MRGNSIGFMYKFRQQYGSTASVNRYTKPNADLCYTDLACNNYNHHRKVYDHYNNDYHHSDHNYHHYYSADNDNYNHSDNHK